MTRHGVHQPRPVAIPAGTFVEDRTKLAAPGLAGNEFQENSQSSLLVKGFEGQLSRHQLHRCASVAQVSNVDVRRRSDRMRLKLPWPDQLDPSASMNCQLLRSSQVSNSSSGPASLGFPSLFKAGPPLIWVFGHFLTFLHHGIEEVKRHLLWKFYKKFEGKVGQMCHRSCSLA